MNCSRESRAGAVVGANTATAVSVWPTVTTTVPEAVRPAASWAVTTNAYAPAAPNVTAVLLAALVPLAANTGAGASAGEDVAAHVYVSPASVPPSPAKTDRVVAVPDTTAGDAAAGVTTAGAVTSTDAVAVVDAPTRSVTRTATVRVPTAAVGNATAWPTASGAKLTPS